MSDAWAALAVLVLAAVTVATRAFFLIPSREWPIPAWLRKGFRHVPPAALAAIVAPEVLLRQGRLVETFADARLAAVAVAAIVHAFGRSVLWTLLAGTATMVALRVGLGW